MNQILVKVRVIGKDETGQQFVNWGAEQVITYKAYQYLEQKNFELLYQCDEDGNQVFGKDGQPNPNLEAQHRQQSRVQRSAEPVVKSGPTAKELEQAKEIEALKQLLAKQASTTTPPASDAGSQGETEKVQGKRGPKKLQTHEA